MSRRWSSLFLGVVLVLGACTSGEGGDPESGDPGVPSTTTEAPCTLENDCLPEECVGVEITTEPWTLHSFSGSEGSHRISTQATASAPTACAGMVDTRLEIRGALDGIETDLFGEREGATAYALVGPLERVITMVVACDGSLPAVSVVARSAQGDDIVEEAIDQVPLTEADCRDHGPDSVDSCELSVDAVNEELVREDGVWTGAVITVGVAGPNCPAPTGLSESSFLAAIAATNGAGNTWNWSDSDGTQGLHVAPGAPDFAEFIYKCGEREGSFPVTFDVTATFEGREFATGSASLDEVVCNATGPDGEAVE